MATAPNRDPTDALEAIYRGHHGLVRWVLRSRGVPEGALDDCTHDVFIAICRRLPERDAELPMRTWVARVARNVAFSRRRSAARDRDRHAQQEPPDPPPRPDEEFERNEAWRALSAFLDELRPEQREVFVMVDVTGMQVSEAATATGKPANTLHSRLKIARRRFTEHFGESQMQPVVVAAARADRRASPSQRRKTWAAITASVEGLQALPPTVTTAAAAQGGWFGSTSLAGFFVGAGTMGAVVLGIAQSTAPAPPAGAHATPALSSAESLRDTPTVGAPAPKTTDGPAPDSPSAAIAEPRSPVQHRPNRLRSARKTSAPSASPDVKLDNDAALVRAVRALQRAREQLQAGQARGALSTVDALQMEFGGLARDFHRVELDAACRVNDHERAKRAAGALRELGALVDGLPRCAQPSKTVP